MSVTLPHMVERTGQSPSETAARDRTARSDLVMTQISGDAWDRIVSKFDTVCQEQLYTYAQARWPQVELQPMLFSRAGRPVGGALVMLQRLPLNLSTIALVKWGPILANDTGLKRDETALNMLELMIETHSKQRSFMLSIMPPVQDEEDNWELAALVSLGFKPGYGIRHPMRYVVDVTLDDDARMAAFHAKWRYNLRKSLKADLTFHHVSADDLPAFMALYQAMSDRKQFPDYSAIGTLKALMDMPGDTARPELFFVRQSGQTIAGAVIFAAGKRAAYLYGATDDSALDLRAGYFLHWHIIRWLRDNTRATLYDLGGTDGSQGLHQFKSGMVGEAGFIRPLPPVFNYAVDFRARFWGHLAYEGREVVSWLRTHAVQKRLALGRHLPFGRRR